MTISDGSSGSGLGIFIIVILGVVSLVVFSLTMLLGLAVVGGIAGGLDTTGDPLNKTASPNPSVGDAVSFDTTWGNAEVLAVHQVRDSTNTSISLTGADDSYVASNAQFTIAADSSWSVCTWARVDSGAASEDMTALSANGRLLLQYNGTQGNWSAWWFDEGSTNSWRVNVSAPNQPGNFSQVCAIHNTTHLSIYRNATEGDVVDTTTGTSIVDANANSANWQGELDETRTFDNALNSSQRQALVNYPVGALPNATRTARITYDEGSGTTTAIYFTSTDAEVSNASWVGGLNGSQLDEGTDYELDQGAASITALSGGLIDGAPVVWIDYRYRPLNRVGQLAEAIEPAYELMASAGLVIPAVVVLALLMGALIGGVMIVRRTDHSGVELFGRRRGGGR